VLETVSSNSRNSSALPFGKIKMIDVLKVDHAATAVRITLVDGKTIEGTVTGGRVDFGTRFEGESDVGEGECPGQLGQADRISALRSVDGSLALSPHGFCTP
jgi:hypothetical protein